MINRAIHIPVTVIFTTLGVAAATSTSAWTASDPNGTWTGHSELGAAPPVGEVKASYLPDGDLTIVIDEQGRDHLRDAIASPSERSCWRKKKSIAVLDVTFAARQPFATPSSFP